MGKFDLKPRGDSRLSLPDSSYDTFSKTFKGLASYGKEGMDILKMVIKGQREIAIIRANTEQQIELIDGEIRKLFAEADSRIRLMQAESQQWHDKFTAKRQAIMELCSILDAHPEYSNEVKAAFIRLYEKQMEES